MNNDLDSNLTNKSTTLLAVSLVTIRYWMNAGKSYDGQNHNRSKYHA